MGEKDEMREWLRQQLQLAGRGARQRLAAHLGFSRPDAITRMLNTDPQKESREIKAHELVKMREFFAVNNPEQPAMDALDEEEIAELLELYTKVRADLRPAARAALAALGAVGSPRPVADESSKDD